MEPIFRKAGAPRGILQHLAIDVARVPELIADARVKGVTVTGSTRAGREVAALAGRHLKPCVLELGGSDAFIVMPSADLDLAVDAGVAARVQNGGQSCIAAKRFIVHEAVAQPFEERFVMAMSRLPTPIICVVIGEGGSGGALGIGVGDRIAVLQFAYYSVISPEGCAGILWKSHDYAPDAARALKLTSTYLQKLGTVDDVIEEPLGAAHRDHHQMAARLKMYLVKTLRELVDQPTDKLLAARYEKFRRMGQFLEPDAPAANGAPT